MTLENRCAQFHEVALGTAKSKGTAKEVATLRRFLHRNQNQRFTDKASTRLLETIKIYSASADGEGLLEDALKMPYTVFGTKAKKKMLRLLEERRGQAATEGNKSGREVILLLVDLDDDGLTLMDASTGDVYENVPLPSDKELQKRTQDAFAATDDTIDVKVMLEGENRMTVVDLG